MLVKLAEKETGKLNGSQRGFVSSLIDGLHPQLINNNVNFNFIQNFGKQSTFLGKNLDVSLWKLLNARAKHEQICAYKLEPQMG